MEPEGPLLHSQVPPPPVPVLSQIDPVHTSHPTSSKSILILSSHLRLGILSSLFPSGFCTKTLCTPLLSSIWTPEKYWVRSTDTHRLQGHQILCSTNQLVTANRIIILLGYNDARS